MSSDFSDFGSGPTSPQTASPGEVPATKPSASSQAHDLKKKMTEELGAVQESLKDGASSAVDKAKEAVSSKTTFAARQVGEIATALEKVGNELENSDQPETGRYTKQLGRSVQAFAKQMENRDIGELATMAEDFGRRQPVAFLGVAALAGLAASRFLTASARRIPKTGPRQQGSETTAGSSMTGRNVNA